MPRAPLVCIERGCPFPAIKHSRCQYHQAGQRQGSTRYWRRRRKRILERDNYRCVYCAKAATTVDHRIPLSRGGTDADSNLSACCSNCNERKGNKTAAEFLLGRNADQK